MVLEGTTELDGLCTDTGWDGNGWNQQWFLDGLQNYSNECFSEWECVSICVYGLQMVYEYMGYYRIIDDRYC